jgi:hypothetical protein
VPAFDEERAVNFLGTVAVHRHREIINRTAFYGYRITTYRKIPKLNLGLQFAGISYRKFPKLNRGLQFAGISFRKFPELNRGLQIAGISFRKFPKLNRGLQFSRISFSLDSGNQGEACPGVTYFYRQIKEFYCQFIQNVTDR